MNVDGDFGLEFLDGWMDVPPIVITPTIAKEYRYVIINEVSFDVGKLLGSGSEGKVYLAKRSDQAEYTLVLKKIDKSRATVATLQLEVELMVKLESSWLPQMFSQMVYAKDQLAFAALKKEENNVHLPDHVIIMKKAPGMLLYDYRNEQPNKHFDPTTAAIVFKEIVRAVLEMHRCGIYHRDLSSANIMVEERGCNVTIIDFGNGSTDATATARCCTTSYASPTMHQGREYRCAAVDIWALGVNLFEMLTNLRPFRAIANVRRTFVADWNPSDDNVIREITSQRAKCPCLTDSAISLLRKLFTINEQRRIEYFQTILQHDFFNFFDYCM